MKKPKSSDTTVVIKDTQIQKMLQFNEVCLKGILLFSVVEFALLIAIVNW